jgi:methionine aminopeptidase
VSKITQEDRNEDSQALSDAIKEVLDRAIKENRHVSRVGTICDAAEALAAQYPCARGGIVFGLICQWIHPWEVDSLEEEDLPGIIDDEISYAKQTAIAENAQ